MKIKPKGQSTQITKKKSPFSPLVVSSRDYRFCSFVLFVLFQYPTLKISADSLTQWGWMEFFCGDYNIHFQKLCVSYSGYFISKKMVFFTEILCLKREDAFTITNKISFTSTVSESLCWKEFNLLCCICSLKKCQKLLFKETSHSWPMAAWSRYECHIVGFRKFQKMLDATLEMCRGGFKSCLTVGQTYWPLQKQVSQNLTKENPNYRSQISPKIRVFFINWVY